MRSLIRVLGVFFGGMMILLSVTITAETLLRKFFSYSLGGVDELGGYAIAIAAPLAFTVALAENAHIRINQIAALFPKKVQSVLNALAVLSLGWLAAYFFYFSMNTVMDTKAYHSVAQTPWATPLIYPQTIWLVAMMIFAIVAVVAALEALALLLTGDWEALRRKYSPASAEDELKAELDDLKKRERYTQ